MGKKREVFFQRKKKNNVSLVDAIVAATNGVIFVSETDSPVLVFAGDDTGTDARETILRHAGLAGDTLTEEVQFDVFFAQLTTIKDWFGEAEMTRAKKFLRIKKLLEENLCDLKVYRFGRIRVDIYAVGIDADGRLLGIKTKAVET